MYGIDNGADHFRRRPLLYLLIAGILNVALNLFFVIVCGIIRGGNSDEFNGMWEDMMTREQLVTVLYRFAQKFGLS